MCQKSGNKNEKRWKHKKVEAMVNAKVKTRLGPTSVWEKDVVYLSCILYR
jgi:hypothetical protein